LSIVLEPYYLLIKEDISNMRVILKEDFVQVVEGGKCHFNIPADFRNFV
jgi:hypothetical protein